MGLVDASQETYFFHHLAMFQFLFSSVALSLGRPYRREFWTNPLFTTVLIVLFFFELWLMAVQPSAVIDFLGDSSLITFFLHMSFSQFS
jgi:hypothetical protein